MSAELPIQPSLRRLRAFDVRPDRDLGQNFLIDSNILEVIGRAADLGPQDIVLEIGGGLGVLSEYLAERAGAVHVIEIDRRLEPALREALDPHPAAQLHFGDAVKLPLTDLDPAPTKLVANLPYGIAASVILRVIEELPTVSLGVAMAQREVGERLAAAPGTGAYGVPSVLAQLSCDVKVLRSVPRNVFHPVPRVDSVLVSLERHSPDPGPAVRALVHAAFAHRRKALGGSLALAPGAAPGVRERVRVILPELGLPADARAERLAPGDFKALAARLAASP